MIAALKIPVTAFAAVRSAKKTAQKVREVGKRKRRMVKMIVPRKSCSTEQSALSTRSLRGLYFLPEMKNTCL